MSCRKRVSSSSLNNAAVRPARRCSSVEICSNSPAAPSAPSPSVPIPAIFAITQFRRYRTHCRASCAGLFPASSSRSASVITSALRFASTASKIASNAAFGTVPINSRICAASSRGRPSSTGALAIAWSMIDSASRIDPSPASASNPRAASSASSPSRSAIPRSSPRMSTSFTA